MKDLRDKVVLITGAANGIGKATALAFAKRGARLVVTDIDGAGAEAVAAELGAGGAEALALKVDVANEEEVAGMIAETIEKMGSLDVLVNNAGVFVTGPAESTSMDDWKWVTDINVWPHVYAIRAALPYFKQRGSGHLVHVASAAGIMGTPGLSAYCMSKFAVFGMVESLAISLYGSGIGVSLVCPLWVNTGLLDRGRSNLDPHLELDEVAVRSLGSEFLKATGIPPDRVAEAMVDGVVEEKFLVLPNPEVLKFAQIKWSDPERYIRRAAEVQNEQRQFFGEVPR